MSTVYEYLSKACEVLYKHCISVLLWSFPFVHSFIQSFMTTITIMMMMMMMMTLRWDSFLTEWHRRRFDDYPSTVCCCHQVDSSFKRSADTREWRRVEFYCFSVDSWLRSAKVSILRNEILVDSVVNLVTRRGRLATDTPTLGGSDGRWAWPTPAPWNV